MTHRQPAEIKQPHYKQIGNREISESTLTAVSGTIMVAILVIFLVFFFIPALEATQ